MGKSITKEAASLDNVASFMELLRGMLREGKIKDEGDAAGAKLLLASWDAGCVRIGRPAE